MSIKGIATRHHLQQSQSKPMQLLRKLSSLRDASDGVSAMEFAIIAPILIFGLIATADIGLALHKRMTIDHVLRAGAQIAMADPGEEELRSALATIAAEHFSVSADDGGLETKACLNDPDPSSEECPPSCDTGQPGSAYYSMSVGKPYAPMIVPGLDYLGASICVRVR